MAPEVIAGNYDAKCDVWSLGVILYVLFTGCPPFNGSNDREILSAIKIGKYDMKRPEFSNLSENAKDLL
jgi:calcium-dependent protein kinase